MPQLIPFYFTHQVTVIFTVVTVVVYMFSKYILPHNLTAFTSRIYVSSKWNPLMPSKPHQYTNSASKSELLTFSIFNDTVISVSLLEFFMGASFTTLLVLPMIILTKGKTPCSVNNVYASVVPSSLAGKTSSRGAVVGVPCPNCLQHGKTVYVKPGNYCPICGFGPVGRSITYFVFGLILVSIGVYGLSWVFPDFNAFIHSFALNPVKNWLSSDLCEGSLASYTYFKDTLVSVSNGLASPLPTSVIFGSDLQPFNSVDLLCYWYFIDTVLSVSNALTSISELSSFSVFNLNSGSPLTQFEIKDFLSLIVVGFGLKATNLAVVTTLSAAVIFMINFINNSRRKLITTISSVLTESVYISVHGIVTSQIDEKKGQSFFPFLFSVFVIILANNLVGMIPYSFALTSQFIITFSLSFTIVIGSTILGLIKHLFSLFSLFVPGGCPLALLYLLTLIEFISYLARPVSLGLRLAANVLSGHMLLVILSGFAYNMLEKGYATSIASLFPLAFIVCFTALEIGIAIIQAQVFTVLSSTYIKDGLKLH